MKQQRLPPELLDFFRKHGANGGKLSGEAHMTTLTPEKRSEIARKAAAVRSKKAAAKNKVLSTNKQPHRKARER